MCKLSGVYRKTDVPKKLAHIEPIKVSFAERLQEFATPQQKRMDLSLPLHRRNKKYDAGKEHAGAHNISSMMKRLRETPNDMRDLKNNLEMKIYKRKLGLDKLSDFQCKLQQSEREHYDLQLSKRDKSINHNKSMATDSSLKVRNEDLYCIDRVETQSTERKSTGTAKSAGRFRTLNHHRIASKAKLAERLEHEAEITAGKPSQPQGDSQMRIIRKKTKLAPLNIDMKLGEVTAVASPLTSHLFQLAKIIGREANEFKTMIQNEPQSAGIGVGGNGKQSFTPFRINTSFEPGNSPLMYSLKKRKSGKNIPMIFDPLAMTQRINEASEEQEGEQSLPASP